MLPSYGNAVAPRPASRSATAEDRTDHSSGSSATTLLTDLHVLLSVNVSWAITFAVTPHTLAAIPIGTCTVFPTSATLMRPDCSVPPPPPPPIALERLADSQSVLPVKVSRAIKLTATPQML